MADAFPERRFPGVLCFTSVTAETHALGSDEIARVRAGPSRRTATSPGIGVPRASRVALEWSAPVRGRIAVAVVGGPDSRSRYRENLS